MRLGWLLVMVSCSGATSGDAIYAITTFSIKHGFNIYTHTINDAMDPTRKPKLYEVGNVGDYPTPGGVQPQLATTIPGSDATFYMPWSGGNLRDHTLISHNGELFAFCTTGWGHGATGAGNFFVLKRKPTKWVFHARITVPHTLQGNTTADTSVIWSPIPWKFPGDRVVVFLSSTCTTCEAEQLPIDKSKKWRRSSVMVYLNDDLNQAIAQADLSVDVSEDTDPFALGQKPQSRYISYQPFERLDGSLGMTLKDEVYSEVNRSTAVPNRVVIGDFASNIITGRLHYFDSLTINGSMLLTEAHTVFPETETNGYRVFYSVFGCSPIRGPCVKGGNPQGRSTRSVWASADFSEWLNDTQLVADGQTLGLVTKVDPKYLPALGG